MQDLGYEKDDLDTKVRKDDFRNIPDDAQDIAQKNMESVKQSLATVDPEEVDEALVNLRYRHYQ